MSYDAKIQIFGKLSDAEAFFDLANTAAAELKTEWIFDLDRTKFLELLDAAASRGGALLLSRRETNDVIDDFRAACRTAGVSYVVHYGETGQEGFTDGYSWKPGMRKEYEFLVAGNNPSVSLAAVRAAADKGIEAVNELVDRVSTLTAVGKIEFADGFKEAYVEYAGAEGPWIENTPGPRP